MLLFTTFLKVKYVKIDIKINVKLNKYLIKWG
jgi:hypothetical protein